MDIESEQEKVIIPSYSAWFSFDKVSEIEKRVFFGQKGGEDAESGYKEKRNFMVRKYRSSRGKRLLMIQCREFLGGDLSEVIKIHSFLEHWGLINYDVLNEKRPGVGVSSKEWEVFSGEFVPGINMCPEEDSRVNGFSIEADLKGGLCFVCNQKHEGKAYYHCLKREQMNVCEECFAEWRLPEDVFGLDFVRIEPGSGRHGLGAIGWTEKEQMLLFEAIERHSTPPENQKSARDTWGDIARFVGTKTPEECLVHFLQLPLEDPFSDTAAEQIIAQRAAFVEKKRIPFAGTANPVLTTLSFLASYVSPCVAESAAKAAMEQIALEKNKGTPFGELKGKMDAIAATAIGVAQANCSEIAEEYEKTIERRVADLIEIQTRKIELKMLQLDEMEAFLEKERRVLEEQRMHLFMERFKMRGEILRMSRPQEEPRHRNKE
eukprot:GHVN01062594.1.p1 GENE.GHVN01062594.1~~GHVN01062594.1.p1  ORF type:complete len:434 (-),score=53.43 GHVN01062594.1:2764-4065(-)